MADITADNPVHQAEDVRQRLLEAAQQLFAERGFDGTSVRDLTSAANCNVAAVNYHFGSKEKLYEEVYLLWFAQMKAARVGSIKRAMTEENGKPSLEKLFTAFGEAFVEPFVGQNRGRLLLQLLDREMMDRRLPEGVFYAEVIEPIKEAMSEALAILCPDMDYSKKVMCVHSFIAQLIHVAKAEQIFKEEEKQAMEIPDRNQLLEHIVKFSVAGFTPYMRGAV